jgi:hypothetical protein
MARFPFTPTRHPLIFGNAKLNLWGALEIPVLDVVLHPNVLEALRNRFGRDY